MEFYDRSECRLSLPLPTGTNPATHCSQWTIGDLATQPSCLRNDDNLASDALLHHGTMCLSGVLECLGAIDADFEPVRLE